MLATKGFTTWLGTRVHGDCTGLLAKGVPTSDQEGGGVAPAGIVDAGETDLAPDGAGDAVRELFGGGGLKLAEEAGGV